MKHPLELKDDARDEAYVYFDKHIRPLTKKADGRIDPTASGLENNDADAFRHAYVSGVFAQEYGEKTADLFGRLNELNPIGRSQPGDESSINMDLWNNSVGRSCGMKAKSRKALLRAIHKALSRGDLILDPKDTRKYKGTSHDPVNNSKPVIVLHEKKDGRNDVFFDTKTGTVLAVEEFVSLIEAGKYPGYSVKLIHGRPTPVSNPDHRGNNNLG
jgi:hypothetical protein